RQRGYEARRPEGDLLHRRGIAEAGADHLRGRRLRHRRPRRLRPARPTGDERLGAGARPVPDAELVPLAGQVLRNTAPHDSETQEHDAHRSSCLLTFLQWNDGGASKAARRPTRLILAPMAKYRGTVKRSDLEGGHWQLVADDGTTY